MNHKDFLNRIYLNTNDQITNEPTTNEPTTNEPTNEQTITTARYNLTNIPLEIKNKIKVLDDDDFMNEISDNDIVVISKIGVQILTQNLTNNPIQLFMTDRWELFADNIMLHNSTYNNSTYNNSTKNTELMNIKDLYKDDVIWNNTVKSSKNILSKVPPPKFIEKWPLIGSQDFRNRMKLSDKDAVVTVRIAMMLAKNQPVKNVFMTDDWELLTNNLKVMKQ